MIDMFAQSGIHLGQQQQDPQKQEPPVSCPPGREQLGSATWSLLHTTAAWFPDAPKESEKRAARQLIESLAVLYPCTHCAEDFRQAVKDTPPIVDSRADLALWACMQHNLVNEKLGKPKYDCSLSKLDERWRDGHPRCFVRGSDGSTAKESLGH
jgi:FAD-linked sulfhydryl oxidase